jgi:hypothetical protein
MYAAFQLTVRDTIPTESTLREFAAAEAKQQRNAPNTRVLLLHHNCRSVT